jgi:hypothetical protein
VDAAAERADGAGACVPLWRGPEPPGEHACGPVALQLGGRDPRLLAEAAAVGPNPKPSPSRNPNPNPSPNHRASACAPSPSPSPSPNPIPNPNPNFNPNPNPNPNPNSNPNPNPIPNQAGTRLGYDAINLNCGCPSGPVG